MQVVRAHPVHGRYDPVEHMIDATVLPAALHGHHVLGIGYHANGGPVPLLAGTDGAGALPLGEILAYGAAVDHLFGLQDGLGEGGRLLFRQGQDMEGQPLGRL